jgi:signal transduction histidine kinase
MQVSDPVADEPTASLAQAFDPFFTTTPGGCATGQGLSIARNVVVDEHGALSFETETGRRSTFNVPVPMGECSAAPKGAP